MYKLNCTRFRVVILCLTLFASSCSRQKENSLEIWEGPHPVLAYSSFIFVLHGLETDSASAEGYWLNQNQYQAHFPVELQVSGFDSLVLRIPTWGCEYRGRFNKNRSELSGYISCAGEDADSVKLFPLGSDEVYGVFPKTSTPIYLADQLAGLDQEALAHFLEELEAGSYGKIHSFLLADAQQVLLERYYFGYSRDVLHAIESVNKSITSLLVARALQDIPEIDLDSHIHDIIQDPSLNMTRDTQELTIRHLLQMTSGMELDDNGVLWAEDRLDFALSRPQLYPPGTVWQYDGGNTVILGRIVATETGQPLDRYAEHTLFQDLGISNYDWSLFKQGLHPLPSGSLWLRPYDMLKIGQLVLNSGRFQNVQVLDSVLVHEWTSASVPTGIDQDSYACHWWVTPLGGDKGRMIWANGIGSQFILIFPQQEIVVVTTGANYENEGQASWDIVNGIKELILTKESFSAQPPPGGDVF